ncbi:ATP-binding protein [Acuticoccus sp.]|uniref:ATP-binding protein n=1 Tax=Acuticoccus sp. TaxID=1904378 RepID=UPI003B5296A3
MEDPGPGIAGEHLEDVFEPFVRIEASRSADTGGAGLGLSIARTLIRAHGGDVTLANRTGGGLVATVRLRRRRS